MRKTLLCSFFIVSSLTLQAQNEYTIDGNIKGLKDGTVIGLLLEDGRVGSLVASDTVRNEKFHFKRNVSGSGIDKLFLMGQSPEFPPMALDLYATPNAKIKITGSDCLLYTWKVDSPVKEQQILAQFVEPSRCLWNEFQRLSIKGRFTEDKNERRLSREKGDSIMSIINKNEVELMRKMPISDIWMNKLYGLSISTKYDPKFLFKEETIALYNRLGSKDKESALGQEITVNLFPPTVVGQGDDMADATLYDLDGKTYHLADFKGKYMLLDFWSSGCGPCIMAIPEMKEIQEQYKEKLTIISLSSDTKSRWVKASAEHNITWENLSDLKQTAGLYAKYGVRGIPNYVLISPDGKIISMWSGYGQGSLKQKMRRFLNNPIQEMTITQQGNTKIVNYPKVKSSNTDIIEIKQVELTDTATIIRIKAYYIPNYWIEMSPQVVIMTDNGTSYPIKKAEGITLGQHFFLPESGEAEFTLTFHPLPMNTQTFSLTEGNEEGNWQLKGIELTK